MTGRMTSRVLTRLFLPALLLCAMGYDHERCSPDDVFVLFEGLPVKGLIAGSETTYRSHGPALALGAAF